MLKTAYRNWSDRLTYLVAEAQILVAGVLISLGFAIIWFQPAIPEVPSIVLGWVASTLLFGPILFGFFVWTFRKLRTREREEVFLINGVTDEREKLYVQPEIWNEKDIEGPGPWPVNDGDAFEVRSIDWDEDLEQLRVRGCYFDWLTDSQLVSVKTMLEDVHNDLIEAYLEYNRLRSRISKMGVQIQGDVINEEAAADERGQMHPRSAVKDRFEAAKAEAEESAVDEIDDVREYVDEYAEEHGIETTGGPPAPTGEAATDGGTDR